MKDKYESLRLRNQLCFPLYAVSNMITRKYKPLLDELDGVTARMEKTMKAVKVSGCYDNAFPELASILNN